MVCFIYLREVGWEDMDWIHLAQDIDRWRVLVNKVMKLRVPYVTGKFLTECLSAFQDGLCSMELLSYF
jgi:hypothetical protein